MGILVFSHYYCPCLLYAACLKFLVVEYGLLTGIAKSHMVFPVIFHGTVDFDADDCLSTMNRLHQRSDDLGYFSCD